MGILSNVGKAYSKAKGAVTAIRAGVVKRMSLGDPFAKSTKKWHELDRLGKARAIAGVGANTTFAALPVMGVASALRKDKTNVDIPKYSEEEPLRKAASKILFLTDAFRSGKAAVHAARAGEKMKALHHAGNALTDTAVPAILGKAIYDMRKQAFIKESSLIKTALIRSGLKMLAKGVGEAGKFVAKHPKETALVAGGTALGAGALGTGLATARAVKQKQMYGPKYMYGGQ
jgi:hypothetical protein